MIDIIRLIAGGLLALCSCYIGVVVKRHYSEREKFYRMASDFVATLSSELSFKKTPLPQVIEKFCYSKKGVFVKFLADFMLSVRRSDPLTKMLDTINISHLKVDEKKTLLSFFFELGKTSLDDQLGTISRAQKEIETKHKKCAEESKRLGGMYFKLAVLVGIALIIIFA